MVLVLETCAKYSDPRAMQPIEKNKGNRSNSFKPLL